MIAIAAVAVAAFLVFLVTRYLGRSQQPEAGRPVGGYTPQWYELLLAAILLLVVVLLALWQFLPGVQEQLAATDWRTGRRSVVFIVAMSVVGAVGLAAFVVFLFARLPRQPRAVAAADGETPATPSEFETPAGARLLGLLALGLAFLLLNWIYVPRAQQYALMLHLIYPASVAVGVVLLFDKATRAWSMKSAGETVREWLFCDGIVFLLLLGFLNLLQVTESDQYASLFWDFLHVVLFFFTFWILDRKLTRFRFLVAYGYLMVLPLLLLISRWVQEVPQAEELSWWRSIWPFFFLSGVFFVLEVIALIAVNRAEKQLVPAVKDAVFLVLYGVLLIVAAAETAA